MKFEDLEFHERIPAWLSDLAARDVQALVFFPNGYGASVIHSPFSYGYEDGLYELAVLKGTESGYHITYESGVTSDVEGYLSEEAVTGLLARIEALPAQPDKVERGPAELVVVAQPWPKEPEGSGA